MLFVSSVSRGCFSVVGSVSSLWVYYKLKISGEIHANQNFSQYAERVK